MEHPEDSVEALQLNVVIPGYVPPAVAQTPEQRDAEIERDSLAYIANARRQDAIARYEAACPTEYRNYDIAHPKAALNRAAINTVLNWKFGKQGLICTGPTGLNKTRSVWALCRRLAYEDGVSVKHYHASDWIASLHECVKYGRDEARSWIEQIAWRPVIVIDDWGQEANLQAKEDWAQSWFFRFLDLRIERGLPVIMTTNLQGKDIASRSDRIKADPLLRRMLELMNVVKFTQPL